jgi:hypothetical protein
MLAAYRVRVFRWYFYIAFGQFLAYFIVPAILFPSRFIKDIEVISALTLGLLPGVFFLLVNVLGLVVDRTRRILHVSMLSVIAVYFLWVLVSWAFIEHMDYLLR